MLKVTAVWSGLVGLPGYSNFYFGSGVDAVSQTQTEADTCANRVRNFFFALVADLPIALRIDINPTVSVIDPANGQLQSEFVVTTVPAQVAGTSGTGYAAPAGAVVNWRTNTIVAGKKLRGKTFLVPLSSQTYDAVGTLNTAFITKVNAATPALIGSALGTGEGLVVWHRPVGGAGGAVGRVVTSQVPDKTAILRSRRD